MVGTTRSEEVFAALIGVATRGGITATALAAEMGLRVSVVRPVLTKLFKRNQVMVRHGINKGRHDRFWCPTEYLWFRSDEDADYRPRPETT